MDRLVFFVDNYVYFDCGWKYDSFYYNRKWIGSTLEEAREQLSKLYAVDDFDIDVREVI